MELQTSKVERQFDRAAATYDSVASLQREMGDRLVRVIPDGETGELVDLGCGTGDLLGKLAQRTSVTLTGVDLSGAMLEQARLKAPTATLIKSDLQRLPFADQNFEWVVSNAALQWCDAAVALREIHRITKPERQVLFTTFGAATLREWRDALAANTNKNSRVHKFPTAKLLLAIMQEIGFLNISVERDLCRQRFETVDDMIDSIRKLGATNARSDRSGSLSGRQWLRQLKQSLEQSRDANGLLTLTYECFYFTATR